MTRLALFAVVLAAAFAAAAAIGRAVGPLERGRAEPEGHEGMGAHVGRKAGAAPAGLTGAANGVRLVVARTTLRARRAETLAFRVLRGSSVVRSFDVEHERQMHLIVVRRDMAVFRHLHPRLGADGAWTTPVRFEEPGAYRAFADFSTGGRRTALAVDVLVGRDVAPALPVAETRVKRAGPYLVTLERRPLRAGVADELEFRVRRAGRPASVDRYLGARGHLVLLRAGDLAYVHTHADEDALRFETTFPSAGSYRAFLQFRAGGAVRTAAFTVPVRP